MTLRHRRAFAARFLFTQDLDARGLAAYSTLAHGGCSEAAFLSILTAHHASGVCVDESIRFARENAPVPVGYEERQLPTTAYESEGAESVGQEKPRAPIVR